MKPWPHPMREFAYHGVLGEYVHGIEEHSEGDPGAILVQCLVCFGNAAGRYPYFTVEDTRHGTNLNVLIAGDTSMGRKGTAFDRAFGLIARADPDWGERNSGEGGLSTAEGLIHAVRDPDDEKDPGVDDKRLLAMMGEFAETLTKMSRAGNTLSSTLRSAWDGKTLSLRTRASPLRATGAHISVIGHVTSADLATSLAPAEVQNGFANRFLWIAAQRARSLPHGGSKGVDDFPDVVSKVTAALAWAHEKPRCIDWDTKARKRWEELYEDLMNGQPEIAAVTNRAAPQVRRLALVYATADRSRRVGLPHLNAALEVWRYSEATVEYLFEGVPDDPAQALVEKVLRRRKGGWVTQSDLYRAFDKSSVRRHLRSAALEALEKTGAVERRVVRTRGRPKTEYRWVPDEDRVLKRT